MRISFQTKTHFLASIALFLMAFLSFSSLASACNLFNWADCQSANYVNYCNSYDPASAQYCSLDRGTQIVSGNINDIEKNRKFSQYVQDIIAYLLLFLGIVGVIYIIYAGFNVLTAAGDEDKVKKSKTTIFHIFIGLVLIFLAYSIVRFFIGANGVGGVLNNAFEMPSLIETTYAYTDYDTNTFDSYKKQIELLSSTLDREYQVNNKITTATLTNLESLVRASAATFPDSQDIIFNANLADSLMTAIALVKKTSDSDNYITGLAKSLNDYLTKVKVNRIKGKITASPATGNAPLTVTLRASDVIDPSGVTVAKANYIWWIRSSGGMRTILGTGPSISYNFPEERTYTVFLNILSSSRNKNGKIDVLPFDSSVNIQVLPKLGNISLAINGVYVSNLDKIKFTPTQGRQGLLIDATASIPATGTRFTSTRFDYGNGNIAQYDNSPSLDRQIYSNVGTYKLRMEVTTNENQKIIKEVEIEIRDPISTIKVDKTNGFARDEFHFSASNTASFLNLGYAWEISEQETGKVLYTSSFQNITYKFLRTGKFAVKLKTFASNGKEDIDTIIINIEGRDPIAIFDSKSASSELPNVLVFDATKSYDPDNLDGGNLSYAWIIDGVRTELTNPTRNGAMGKYTFDTIGTHKVTLEVSNKDGKTIAYSKDITIDSLLSIRLIIAPKIVQAGSSLSFIVDSKEAQTFEWQFGDGETDTSITGRMNHIYKKAGTYSVNVIVHGRNSDNNSITRKVYVTDSNNPFAIITLKRDNEEIVPVIDACDGKEAFVIDRAKAITLSAENSINTDGTPQNINYTWKYGTKNSSQRDFSYKFDELGCFPVTLTVRSKKNGTQDTTQAYVKVENIAPELSSLSIVTDKIDTDPVMVTVTANNTVDKDGVISSYIWYYYTQEDPEPQDFRITRSPKTTFVLPRIGAKYYFAVILEDSNGLKVNSDEMSTERYSLTLTADNINTPIISIKASSTNISVDQKIDFTVTAKNILGTDLVDKAEYKWDYNGDGFYEETTNTPKVSHTYSVPGNFNFKVKVTYKGISNTKYLAITVKNEIQPNLEYIAIGNKFIFLNTTKGLYTKVKWSLGDTISETPDSFSYDFGEGPVSGDITLEVSDGTNRKSTSTRLRKDIINALKLKKSTEPIVYFSFPNADNDTIHIQNSADKFYLYLGESKGNIAKYGIDTDILVDSNLNGDPADDIDNKGTDSSAKGSVFIVKSFDISAREKTLRITLYDINNKIIATKDIKISYDFNTGINTESLSGTLSEVVSKDISETDKVNLEKLKDLIKGAQEQDRLRLMQYFSALQENWFDTREKTKIIIDFENYIDVNSALDTSTKDLFYSLLEGFLLTDTQVKDDVGLAIKVLKSLIPKTNSSYSAIMKNIDDIISHPTNLTLNKELGIFILNAIKDDTTIEVKDKNIIKSQLQTIIYGGQSNIPTNITPTTDTTSTSGILGFILGFGKILGFIILGFLGIFITAFVYFKVLNRDDNLGFQDFIIDKISGKQPVKKSASVSVQPIPLKKEEKSQVDILTNIAPNISSISIPDVKAIESVTNSSQESYVPPVESTIPDWLKESTNLVSSPTESTIPENLVLEENFLKSSIETDGEKNTDDGIIETKNIPSLISENTANISSESGIPDWLKGSGDKIITTEENIFGESPEEKIITTESEISDIKPLETSDKTESDLPTWMKGIDQESLKQEIVEEMTESVNTSDDANIPDWLRLVSSETPASSLEENNISDISKQEIIIEKPEIMNTEIINPIPIETTSSHEDIPDWLRSTPIEILDTTKVSEIVSEDIIEPSIISEEKTKVLEQKTKPSPQKKPKKEDINIVETIIKKEDSITRPKKKKPVPVISEGPVISGIDEELPDWLK